MKMVLIAGDIRYAKLNPLVFSKLAFSLTVNLASVFKSTICWK